MNRITMRLSILAWLLGSAGTLAQPPGPAIDVRLPWQLDPAVLAGQGLSDVPPVPKEVLLSGESRPRRAVLHLGNDIVVVVYEEQPVKLALRGKGMPYNEFVHVLAGTLVLTDESGHAHEYHVGDFLVIPQGFTGTWETRGTFRELVVITREAWDATH